MTYSEFLIEFAQAFHINGCDIYIKKVENIFQPNYVYKKIDEDFSLCVEHID